MDPVKRLLPTFCIGAAAIIVLQQLLSLGVGLNAGLERSAAGLASPLHTVIFLLALVGFVLLLLALVGLYDDQAQSLGGLGAAGFLTAFFGTVLTAGDWWFESFAVPEIARAAPQILEQAPGGRLLLGGVVTFLTFGIGWILFAAATLRARTFPRSVSILLIVGAALAINGGTPLFHIPLAVAIGWMGYWLRSHRLSVDTPIVSRGSIPIPGQEAIDKA